MANKERRFYIEQDHVYSGEWINAASELTATRLLGVESLTPEQQSEYRRMVDGLCRMCHTFEPTQEQHEMAIKHAQGYSLNAQISGGTPSAESDCSAIQSKGASMNLKYRKKPIVIEAFQMTKERRASNAEWPEWMNRAWQLDREAPGSLYPTEKGTSDGTLSIGTLAGQHIVSWGDWIIQGVYGELYTATPETFEATYEPADEQLALAQEPCGW
jgi:hypothetical protein